MHVMPTTWNFWIIKLAHSRHIYWTYYLFWIYMFLIVKELRTVALLQLEGLLHDGSFTGKSFANHRKIMSCKFDWDFHYSSKSMNRQFAFSKKPLFTPSRIGLISEDIKVSNNISVIPFDINVTDVDRYYDCQMLGYIPQIRFDSRHWDIFQP